MLRMRYLRLAYYLLALGVLAAHTQVQADDSFGVPSSVANILQNHCMDCHGDGSAEGDVELDTLSTLHQAERLALLEKVQEQLFFGLMPPEEEPQLSNHQKDEIGVWIRAELTKAGRYAAFTQRMASAKYANYVDHDKLFSGEYRDLKGFTYDRKWMISEFIFKEKMNALLKVSEARRTSVDGKSRVVRGNSLHEKIANPFLLPSKSGIHGARMYREVFPEMIRAWREAFQDEALPFCILSQCTAGEQQTLDNFLVHLKDIGARIREAQYQTFLDFYNEGDKTIGFVSTYDLRHSNYHPRVKIPAGERAAIWALVSQYGVGNDLHWLPPVLKEMKVVNGALELTFSEAVGDNSDGTGLSGFAVAGEDMKFQPAEVTHKVVGQNGRKAQHDKTTLVLRSTLVDKPVHYRYAWGRNPMGDIQRSVRFGNTVMLPTQRSDRWSNADLLKALTGIDAEDPGQLSRSENNALRAALAKEDERRKLAEARAALEQANAQESE